MQENNIKITRDDVLWGYGAQIFSLGSGIILLPIILYKLDAQEVGFNYVLLSMGVIISLLDFGFCPQLIKSVTYIYGGANTLLREGVDQTRNTVVNYNLLSLLLGTAKWIYFIIGLIVVLVMATLGTLYVYQLTEAFSLFDNVLYVWIIYTLSIFLQIYYSYVTSFLCGAGLIKESKIAIVLSQLTKILLTLIFLFLGWGLLGVVTANFIAPFILRYISWHYYFTPNLQSKLILFKHSLSEKWKLFKILWCNSKKAGICTLNFVLIYQIPPLLITSFLGLELMASYGLLAQLVALVSSFSAIFYVVIQPRLTMYLMDGRLKLFFKDFVWSIFIVIVCGIGGDLFIIFLGGPIIHIVSSSTTLPVTLIVILYCLFRFVLDLFWSFVQVSVMKNKYPFLRSFTLCSVCVPLLVYMTLKFTNLGLLGVVLSFGVSVIGLLYWVQFELKELHLSFELFGKALSLVVKEKFSAENFKNILTLRF